MEKQLTEIKKEVEILTGKLTDLKGQIAKVIIGQDETVEHLLITFLAGGHALLEGVPGLAKTLMIKTLAQAIDLKFKRIQFTPDLMPSDIIGTEILEEDHATGKKFFEFNRGADFCQYHPCRRNQQNTPKNPSCFAGSDARIRSDLFRKNVRFGSPVFYPCYAEPHRTIRYFFHCLRPSRIVSCSISKSVILPNLKNPRF